MVLVPANWSATARAFLTKSALPTASDGRLPQCIDQVATPIRARLSSRNFRWADWSTELNRGIGLVQSTLSTGH